MLFWHWFGNWLNSLAFFFAQAFEEASGRVRLRAWNQLVSTVPQSWLFGTPWTAVRQASLSITNSWSLLKLMFFESVMPSNHLILSTISSPSPTFNLPQHQGLLKWVSSSHHVAKVLEFQLHHQSFQWISGLISFRMDWLDLLEVHRTLKNLLQTPQFKSINSSVLRFLFMFLQTFIHVLFSPDTWIHYHMSKT